MKELGRSSLNWYHSDSVSCSLDMRKHFKRLFCKGDFEKLIAGICSSALMPVFLFWVFACVSFLCQRLLNLELFTVVIFLSLKVALYLQGLRGLYVHCLYALHVLVVVLILMAHLHAPGETPESLSQQKSLEYNMILILRVSPGFITNAEGTQCCSLYLDFSGRIVRYKLQCHKTAEKYMTVSLRSLV